MFRAMAAESGSDTLGRELLGLAAAARSAYKTLGIAAGALRNEALLAMARFIDSDRRAVMKANQRDLVHGRSIGLQASLLDRLELNSGRIDAMIESLHAVAQLPDPIGSIDNPVLRPSGIRVGTMRVPLGVIGIIYESRPNVTADASALCIKTGNAVILRGGSEAIHSNHSIANCLHRGLDQAGLPSASIQVLHTTDRAAVSVLATMRGRLDLLIPRGGKSLIQRLNDEATVPMLKHLDGVCHIYIDGSADLDMAKAIALNAKTQRFGVCNAMETLLIDRQLAESLLPELAGAYRQANVELRGCEAVCSMLEDAVLATEEDWYAEYLGPQLAVRIVADVEEAIDHINRYGSAHTDAIIAEAQDAAHRFLREVDSSSVIHNASTRFADGFEYGLGAEIGISTDKLHARGPVGLEGLTSQKYVVLGSGQIRRN